MIWDAVLFAPATSGITAAAVLALLIWITLGPTRLLPVSPLLLIRLALTIMVDLVDDLEELIPGNGARRAAAQLIAEAFDA